MSEYFQSKIRIGQENCMFLFGSHACISALFFLVREKRVYIFSISIYEGEVNSLNTYTYQSIEKDRL